MNKNIEKYLTVDSRKKLQGLSCVLPEDLISFSLLDRIVKAFQEKFHIESYTGYNISEMKNEFISWEKEINGANNFDHINQMNRSALIVMRVDSLKIDMYLLYEKGDMGYIATLIHAINTFFRAFKTTKEHVTIHVCLSNNKRSLLKGCSDHNDCIRKMRENNAGFTVSGTTNKSKNSIFLMRKEEITKLLFHELIHYVELDSEYHNILYVPSWDISDKLLVYEAYTEFLAVYINSAYLACHLGRNNRKEYFEYIIGTEIYYSLRLCVTILKFYGYNRSNYREFFRKKKYLHKQPIYLWEYIFLRTLLLLNATSDDSSTHIMNIIDKDSMKNRDDTFDIYNDLSQNLSDKNLWIDFDNDDSVSYLAIDIEWNESD